MVALWCKCHLLCVKHYDKAASEGKKLQLTLGEGDLVIDDDQHKEQQEQNNVTICANHQVWPSKVREGCSSCPGGAGCRRRRWQRRDRLDRMLYLILETPPNKEMKKNSHSNKAHSTAQQHDVGTVVGSKPTNNQERRTTESICCSTLSSGGVW